MTPLSATSWLSTLGALCVFVVMVAETGLLIGFFLPGDSVLLTTGLFGATRTTAPVHLSLPAALVAAAGGALTGAQVGLVLGRRGAHTGHTARPTSTGERSTVVPADPER